jgi:hypothetical protein
MIEPTTADWDRVRALCSRAGLLPKSVDRLEKCWSRATSFGADITLLAGSRETLALLLARWLGPDVGAALAGNKGSALAIGPKPEAVQPPVGRWPYLVRPELGQRHVMVVPSTGAVNLSLRSELEGLGVTDQLLLVTRLSQPLSSEECHLAESLAQLSATARAVFLALPSEEGTPAERAELAAYGVAQLEANGFRGRCLGAAVWYTEGTRPADTIQRLDDWLTGRPDDIAEGRLQAVRASLVALIDEIEKAPDRLPDTKLSVEDADERIRQFASHVSHLGQRLGALASAGEFPDTASCRRFMIESLEGWLHGASGAGMLLDCVERVRPGIKAELPGLASTAAELLQYEAPQPPPTPQPFSFQEELHRTGVAIGAAVLTGVIIYLVGSLLLASWLATFVSVVCAIAAFLVMFGAPKSFRPSLQQSPPMAHSWFSRYLPKWANTALGMNKQMIEHYRRLRDIFQPEMRPSQQEAATTGYQQQPSAVPGWASAEVRLTNWFNSRIRCERPTLRQECVAVRSHFQL